MKHTKTKRKKGNSKKAPGHTATAIANYENQGLTWSAHRGSRGLIRLLFYFIFIFYHRQIMILPQCPFLFVGKFRSKKNFIILLKFGCNNLTEGLPFLINPVASVGLPRFKKIRQFSCFFVHHYNKTINWTELNWTFRNVIETNGTWTFIYSFNPS